jgi:long-chain acyl-CoA synthetase
MSTEEAVLADTFPKLLLEHSKRRGDRPAMREKRRGIWHTTTWREFADDVQALAAALSASGLRRGDHVALLGDNRPRLHVAMCASQWLGAVVVPLFQDASADEITAPLRDAAVSFAFAENQEQVDKLLSVMPSCPLLRGIVYDHDRGMRHYKQSGLLGQAALLQQGRELLASSRERLLGELSLGSATDAAALFFTSGTTGPAKGVVMTHGALIDRARVAANVDQLHGNDVVVAYLPPAWIGQHLFAYAQPLVVGHCVCCPEASDTMLADMREIGPTCFLASPRVLEALRRQVTVRMEDAGPFKRGLYHRFIEVARRVGAKRQAGEGVSFGDRLAYFLGDLLIYGPLRDVLGMSRLRVAYTSGDGIGASLLNFYRALGINLKQLYGSTETGFFVAMQRDGAVQADAVGPALQGVEISFTPQREVLVRSAGLFKSFHGAAANAGAGALPADGWYATGDIGFIGADGQLRIIDRVQDIGRLSNGTEFTPRRVESRLKYFPYVKDAVAFGDGREGVCMLVGIDAVATGIWADKKGISYTGHADLASREEVYGLIAECLAEVNAELAREPELAGLQVRRFALLPQELDADDGLLTRMRRVRRRVVSERYQALLDALHGGAAAVDDIKIRDARLGSAAPLKSAA